MTQEEQEEMEQRQLEFDIVMKLRKFYQLVYLDEGNIKVICNIQHVNYFGGMFDIKARIIQTVGTCADMDDYIGENGWICFEADDIKASSDEMDELMLEVL